jgi:predicted DNA-binding transcriptional regulator AlpA
VNSEPLDFLKLCEVARELRTTPRNVPRLVAAGVLPKPYRVGRSPRWRRSEIVAALEKGRQ